MDRSRLQGSPPAADTVLLLVGQLKAEILIQGGDPILFRLAFVDNGGLAAEILLDQLVHQHTLAVDLLIAVLARTAQELDGNDGLGLPGLGARACEDVDDLPVVGHELDQGKTVKGVPVHVGPVAVLVDPELRLLGTFQLSGDPVTHEADLLGAYVPVHEAVDKGHGERRAVAAERDVYVVSLAIDLDDAHDVDPAREVALRDTAVAEAGPHADGIRVEAEADEDVVVQDGILHAVAAPSPLVQHDLPEQMLGVQLDGVRRVIVYGQVFIWHGGQHVGVQGLEQVV